VDLDAGSFLLIAEGSASGEALSQHATRLPSADRVMLDSYKPVEGASGKVMRKIY
jgi:hypothetical protein